MIEFGGLCAQAHIACEDLSKEAEDWSDQLHDGNAVAATDRQIEKLMPFLKGGPTGLFVLGSTALPIVYRSMMARSIRIGQDVKIIAGDYDPPTYAALNPMPACVDVQIPTIAQRVVKLLMWRIANREAPGPEGIVVPPRLVRPVFE
jgi:DNA-binding LacI/PurR family transcriptional regulator